MELMEHQLTAITKMRSGCVLYGSVGSGKTAAALGYYVQSEAPKDIIVITTAKKRDSLDWEQEAAKFGIGTDASLYGRLVVDSWNNVGKYTDVRDAFFVFDEQRVIGHGIWVKSFFKITKESRNHWILLSATPGDNWSDYAPIFVANGYFVNITDFKRKHVKLKPYLRYPVIECYLDEWKLETYRNAVLVEMPFEKLTTRMMNWTPVAYDKDLFDRVYKKRWHVYEDRPIKDAAELFRVMRRVVNSDPSRLEAVRALLKEHPKLIIFYTHNYELALLRVLAEDNVVGEWNGHVKNPVPKGDKWVYLVQYTSGAEGWNCVETDAMCLYSLTYSYKLFEQAPGRIDRMNTPFCVIKIYPLLSDSLIDRVLAKTLDKKRSFNMRKMLVEMSELEQEIDEKNDVTGEGGVEDVGTDDEILEMCQI